MTHYQHSVMLYRHETKIARKREARAAARLWIAVWFATMTAWAVLCAQ